MGTLPERPVGMGQSPPIFNIPGPLVLLVLVLLGFHLPREIGFDQLANALFLHLAFVPLRYYGGDSLMLEPIATVLSPVGYSLIHHDWFHLLINLGMLIAFGKAVIEICGTRVFVTLYVIGALAGSAIVLVSSQNPQYPLIGASASVSALVGAVICLGIMQSRPMPRPFHHRRSSIQFLLVWVAVNVLFALPPFSHFAGGFTIAWHAHLAGLAVGYFYAWRGLNHIVLNPPHDD